MRGAYRTERIKEVAENNRNEKNLRNVLQPIQEFSEFYQSNYRGERLIVSKMVTWIPKRDQHAASVLEKIFLWHLFESVALRCNQEGENHIFKKKI